MTRFPGLRLESLAALKPRGLATYALELVVVGAAYFVLSKVFLALDPIYPGGVPDLAAHRIRLGRRSSARLPRLAGDFRGRLDRRHIGRPCRCK